MENTLNRGEELFKKYNGNFYLMSLDGELDKYKSLNIDRVNEEKWNNDLKNDLIYKLKKDPEINDTFFELCEIILEEDDLSLYLSAISIIDKRKDYLNCVDKLLIAEQIAAMLETYSTSPNSIKNNMFLFEFSLDLTNSIIKCLESSNLQIPDKYINKPKLIRIDKDKINVRTKNLNLKLNTIKESIYSIKLKAYIDQLNSFKIAEINILTPYNQILYKMKKNNSNKPTNLLSPVAKHFVLPNDRTTTDNFVNCKNNHFSKLDDAIPVIKLVDNTCSDVEFVSEIVPKLNSATKEEKKVFFKHLKK